MEKHYIMIRFSRTKIAELHEQYSSDILYLCILDGIVDAERRNNGFEPVEIWNQALDVVGQLMKSPLPHKLVGSILADLLKKNRSFLTGTEIGIRGGFTGFSVRRPLEQAEGTVKTIMSCVYAYIFRGKGPTPSSKPLADELVRRLNGTLEFALIVNCLLNAKDEGIEFPPFSFDDNTAKANTVEPVDRSRHILHNASDALCDDKRKNNELTTNPLPLNRKGPKLTELFVKVEYKEMEQQRFLNHLRKYALQETVLNASKESRLNKVVVCFVREWIKCNLVEQQPSAPAIFRFLTDDCGLRSEVIEKTYCNDVREWLREDEFFDDTIRNQVLESFGQ